VPENGYSVTLPPYANGDPAVDNAAFHPDPQRLGLLNVRYLASAFNLDDPYLKLMESLGGTRIYENRMAYPRAWVQAGSERTISASPADAQPASILSQTPNRIQIQMPDLASSGEYILVTSEIAYPGWRVWVDGKPAQILTVDGLLRGVRIQGGAHQIVFSFLPFSLIAGLALWVCGMILLWTLAARLRPERA
jgi:hypothetical protein